MFYIFKKLIIQSDFFTKIICFSLIINTFFVFLFFIYSAFRLKKKILEVDDNLKNFRNLQDFSSVEVKSEIIRIMIKSSEKFFSENFNKNNEIKEKIWELILVNYLNTENSIIIFLNTSASISTLIGLLGTVWGIVNSFMGIASSGGGDLSVVAPGIAEALITTIAGLFVAIPAILFSSYLKYLKREICIKYQNVFIYLHRLFSKNIENN